MCYKSYNYESRIDKLEHGVEELRVGSRLSSSLDRNQNYWLCSKPSAPFRVVKGNFVLSILLTRIMMICENLCVRLAT